MLKRVTKKMLINSKQIKNIIWSYNRERIFSYNCKAVTSLQFDFGRSEVLHKA